MLLFAVWRKGCDGEVRFCAAVGYLSQSQTLGLNSTRARRTRSLLLRLQVPSRLFRYVDHDGRGGEVTDEEE